MDRGPYSFGRVLSVTGCRLAFMRCHVHLSARFREIDQVHSLVATVGVLRGIPWVDGADQSHAAHGFGTLTFWLKGFRQNVWISLPSVVAWRTSCNFALRN